MGRNRSRPMLRHRPLPQAIQRQGHGPQPGLTCHSTRPKANTPPCLYRMLHLSFCHTLPAITELHGRHANKPTGSGLPIATMPPHAGRALTCSPRAPCCSLRLSPTNPLPGKAECKVSHVCNKIITEFTFVAAKTKNLTMSGHHATRLFRVFAAHRAGRIHSPRHKAPAKGWPASLRTWHGG